MKRWIGLSLLLVPLLASAAGFWDGNAALQRGDSTFESGSFAASDSFPPDTRVLVTNLETGKTAEATVTKRIDSQSDIMILLSPMAASALGLSRGAMASVRVTVISRPEEGSAARSGEQTFSMDPDVNPGAAYGGLTQTPTPAQQESTQQAAEVPLETPTPQPDANPSDERVATHTPVAEPATTPAAEVPVEPAAQNIAAQAAAAQQQAEDAAVIAEAAARTPQKQLFLPPREDEKFAYTAPVETPRQPATAQATPETQPTAAEITAVIGEPTVAPAPRPLADISLAEAAAPQESRPEEIFSAHSESPALGRNDAVALAIPEPKPEERKNAAPEAAPQQQPVQQAKPPETTRPAAASLPRTGKAGTYFLQLAAYATEKVAQDVASRLTPTYPTLVIAPQATGTRAFRVVIGPLNRAESGTLLTWFRYRGFPDAFLKQE
jgi:rare lipoprotein A (peptidoglycan hydrolase)